MADVNAEIRWALMALGLVRNKLTAMGIKAEGENGTAIVNVDAAIATLEPFSDGAVNAEQPRHVPPDYKLVPVEPTEDMLFAGARSQGATVYYKEVLAIYRAMVAAAGVDLPAASLRELTADDCPSCHEPHPRHHPNCTRGVTVPDSQVKPKE